MNNVIKINKLNKTFYQVNQVIKVLHNINLEINHGDFISIIGPSGSGKTTLLNIIGTLDNYSEGKYLFDNIDIKKLKEKEKNFFRNKNIGFIHQFHYLIPELSPLENVILPLLISGLNIKESKIKGESLLIDFGLKDRINLKTKYLSGGEQQRISIARAMINNPILLIADEMTGNLDEKNSKNIFEFFIEKANLNNQTIIFVTHNNKLATKAKNKYRLENFSLTQYD